MIITLNTHNTSATIYHSFNLLWSTPWFVCFCCFNPCCFAKILFDAHTMLSPFVFLPLGSRRVSSFPYKACGCFLTAFKTATWIGSLPFNGHLCLPSKDFCASSEMKHNLFKFTTSSLYKGPLKFIVASVHCCTLL